ncbi:translation elongation factor Ts [bacterium]|nr:translation elongation factor Ts [bacterium]MBT6832199.1 translation elongation factor Ts [bacterium]MBT6996144.1 translation elongation factor Ts [bacterium]MBT7772224.1 translation elongation factor Ts [bacterium]
MAISAADVKILRDKTGVGMLACKNALEESGGEMDAAIELLRKRGESKAASKAERSTSEGGVAISGRAIIKVLCETDFVARNEKFVELTELLAKTAESGGNDAAKNYFESVKTDQIQEIGENMSLDFVEVVDGGTIVGSYLHTNRKVGTIVVLEGGTSEMARDVAMHATAMDPLVATPDEVPAELLEKEKEIAREQLIAAGKPEQILEKIIAGKIQKFCAERALSSQPFVKNPEQTVAEFLGDVKLVKFVRVAV